MVSCWDSDISKRETILLSLTHFSDIGLVEA